MTNPARRFLIQSMTWQPDGIAIEFMDVDSDLRETGMQMQHVIFVPTDAEHEDEIDGVTDAAMRLLIDALQDYGNTPAIKVSDITEPTPPADDDEDEDVNPHDPGDPSYYDLPSR